MKLKCFITLILICLLSSTIASSFGLSEQDLVLNGRGRRTMTLIGAVYTAELWVPEQLKGKGPADIINSDVPMAVLIELTSRMITKDRFVSAVRDGFKNASGSGYPTDNSEIFLSLFDNVEFSRGDKITLHYTPDEGTKTLVLHKDSTEAQHLGAIYGIDFKQSLFAIWLGPEPVQKRLKQGMLGKR